MVGVNGSLDELYYEFDDGTYLAVDYDYESYSEKYPNGEISWWITLNKDSDKGTKTLKGYFYKTYDYSLYGDDIPEEVNEKYEKIMKKLIKEHKKLIKRKNKK